MTNVESKTPAQTVEWDAHEYLMRVTRHYLIDGAPTATVANATTIAATMTATDPIDTSATITCLPVSRSARYYNAVTGNLVSDVTVVYEGHKTGFVRDYFEPSAKSEKIVMSLDATPEQIGARGEGVNHIAGNVIWCLIYNRASLLADSASFALIGSVNDDGWLDPNRERHWPEGTWLYLAPQVAQNRDGSYTVHHRLQYVKNADAHMHKWRHYKDRQGTVTETFGAETTAIPVTLRKFSNTEHSPKIQLIAGTDMWQLFSDAMRPN